MSNRQMEREEEELERQLAAGEITQAEFRREINELHRDYRAAAHEAAARAYENEMERW